MGKRKEEGGRERLSGEPEVSVQGPCLCKETRQIAFIGDITGGVNQKKQW